MSANPAEYHESGWKRCGRCHEWKPVDQFPRKGSGVQLASRCRPCKNLDNRESYQRHGRRPRSKSTRVPRLSLAPSSQAPCVCGALRRHHRRNGRGSCAATRCPGFFERAC